MAGTDDNLKQLLDQRERELQAREQRFRNVINRLADGIIIVDAHGAVRFANRAAEQLFDRSADELVGAEFGFPIIVGEATEVDIRRRSGDTVVVEMCVVEI